MLFSVAGSKGPSVVASHIRGEVAYDETTDALWCCVEAGNPGNWRKLSGLSTAGAFHAITPARVYDSRKPAPLPGVLATGQTRTVSIADRRDPSNGSVVQTNVVPARATAIAYNLTIVSTVGSNGFLAVNEGGNTTVSASVINWSASGLTLANSTVVKVSNAQITVICGGTSTSCHFIIDVLGYYR